MRCCRVRFKFGDTCEVMDGFQPWGLQKTYVDLSHLKLVTRAACVEWAADLH